MEGIAMCGGAINEIGFLPYATYYRDERVMAGFLDVDVTGAFTVSRLILRL
jgi:hypothetical protein